MDKRNEDVINFLNFFTLINALNGKGFAIIIVINKKKQTAIVYYIFFKLFIALFFIWFILSKVSGT